MVSNRLKHVQEMHENNAKWNRAIEKIKKINVVSKYSFSAQRTFYHFFKYSSYK